MSPRRKTAALVLVGAIASLGLAACGGGDAAAPTPTLSAPLASVSASPTTMPGNDPATWAPVILKKGTKTAEMVTRQVAIWPALEYAKNKDFTAVSSDPTVVEILPSDSGTVVGFRAVAPGEATVKVYKTADATGKAFRKVKVTVTE